MERRSFLTATGGAIVVLVAGCSGDGDGDGGATDTPTPTSTPTESPTTTQNGDGASAQDQYPDYNWDMLDGAETVATDTVTMNNTRFDPLIATVTPGTDVTFRNEDSFGHTVTIPQLEIDRQVESGQSITVTFENAGTYDYVCTFHPPDMLGRIDVTDTQQGETTTSTDEETTTETATETTTETSDGGETTTDDGGGYY